MHWRSFVIWNALGGISWAVAIGLIAYFLGHSASNALESFGVFGLVAAVLAVISFVVLHRRHRARSARGGHEKARRRGADPRSETPGESGPPS
jgi:membrane protein DedA with SNARE-associated domain